MWVWLLCGFDCFVGIGVVRGFVGISMVCGYQRGCAVGIGVVMLWFMGIGMGRFVWFLLSCAMVWFLIWSNCFCFVLFVCLFLFLFLFFVFVFLVVVGGCKLRSGRGTLLGDVFFIFFPCCYGLWLWLVGVTMEVVEVADAIVLFIINLMNYLYYFKWVAKNIESLMLGIL